MEEVLCEVSLKIDLQKRGERWGIFWEDNRQELPLLDIFNIKALTVISLIHLIS